MAAVATCKVGTVLAPVSAGLSCFIWRNIFEGDASFSKVSGLAKLRIIKIFWRD
jgi:hypothetical protein